MFYVYILRGTKNHLYVGCTSNLERRIDRHIKGAGAEFTKRNQTNVLVYKEIFSSLKEARQREKQIKGWSRFKKENLIIFGKPIL